MNTLPPMTPEEVRTSEELSAFAGELFLKRGVSYDAGIRMLATMVTWMAVQDGLSSKDFGALMTRMHEVMSAATRSGAKAHKPLQY